MAKKPKPSKSAKKPKPSKSVETLRHDQAKRRNIPTAEHQSVVDKVQDSPRTLKYPRNIDLDRHQVVAGVGFRF